MSSSISGRETPHFLGPQNLTEKYLVIIRCIKGRLLYMNITPQRVSLFAVSRLKYNSVERSPRASASYSRTSLN